MSSPSASSSGSSSSYSSSSAPSSTRRGSAPASAFLAPRFWSQPQFDMPPPRRTSFGTALAGGNGRLAALSALSMQPRSPVPAPSPAALAKPQPQTAPSTPVQPASLPSTPQQQPKPQQPQQQQRKQNVCFLPGPDGLCVESRRRRGSEA